MWETTADSNVSESSYELELSFDDDIIREVKRYREASVAEIVVQP